MKKRIDLFIRKMPIIICVALIGAGLVIYPETAAKGIRNGLTLLGNNLIPSLFPFTVFSSYISENAFSEKIAVIIDKPMKKVFKIGGNAVIPFLLGTLGGYPVGAKTAADFYKSGKLTENEAQRLLFWAVNPSPAFTVTAVGTFMLRNTKCGLIIYFSSILASLTVGFFCRFLSDGKKIIGTYRIESNGKNALVKAVTGGTEAILGISGWVLTFSALSSLCDKLAIGDSARLFIKSVLEVTTACETVTSNALPLTVIASAIGFGGFAVIFQTASYCEICSLEIKKLICARIVLSAFTSLYTAVLLKIFPQTVETSATINVIGHNFSVYHSIPAAAILMIMCAALILEVDNRKKVC